MIASWRTLAGTVACAVVAGLAGPGCTDVLDGSDPTVAPSGDDEENPPDIGGDDVAEDAGPQKGPLPSFGTTISRTNPPPPISGGTLLVTKDGARAVAADPDRDRVYVVSLADDKVLTVALSAHDEPGRVAEDDTGVVHVALRRGGAVVSIDPKTATVLARRAVCPSPRGIAFDPGGKRLLVACEGGELVAVPPAAGGAPATLARIPDRDLRDVVVMRSDIYVSRYRSAEVLKLDANGAIVDRRRPITLLGAREGTLAWRMIAPRAQDPQVPLVVQEAAASDPVTPVTPTGTGGYGAPAQQQDPTQCNGDGAVVPVITQSFSNGPTWTLPDQAVLPVDIATDGTQLAVVAAGNGHTAALPQVFLLSTPDADCSTIQPLSADGQVIAAAYASAGTLVVQSREPAQLQIFTLATLPRSRVVPLASESVEDTGHAVFHSNTGSGIACASCHGEGGDDGHVWTFSGIGLRRTPSLRGTVEGTAPYHWDGHEASVAALAADVLTKRMNGPTLASDQAAALERWLYAIPAPAPLAVDATAAARGKALFTREDVGCSSCHSGAKLTSSATVDVGTGGAFQVPPLVGVATRAPYLHDGCASTLMERFTVCGTKGHGDTSSLSSSDLDDLVTYMESL